MKYQHQRKAFSMVTAIVVIVLMATVAMLVMSMSGKMVKETTAQYQDEQAALLAKSYTEYAVMAVTANDRSIAGGGQCLTIINGRTGNAVVGVGGAAGNPNNGYLISTNISYIGTAAALGLCAAPIALDDTVNIASKTPLTIIVDVYVQYKDLDNPAPNAPNMTYHRRTVQKI